MFWTQWVPMILLFLTAVFYVGRVIVICWVLYTIWQLRKVQDSVLERATSIEVLLRARNKE